MKKIIMYLLVFVGIQMLAGGVVQLAYSLLKDGAPVDAIGLMITTVAADVVVLFCFLYFKWGLLAPLVEELVFRGAILRGLLRWHRNPWLGIAISAVLFSVVHMNPAQMPHAFLIGLLLGWMYYRTDSIVPGVVYHWVNNTVAYVLYAFYPDPDIKLNDIFMGNQQNVLLAVVFSLCIFIPSLLQLNIRMKKAE